MIIDIVVILIASGAIYYAGEHFATASSFLGNYMGLSKSAKGATIDAISSSAPELLIALFSVIIFHEFEIGIGTVVGSALFNILLIPAVCVFVSPVIFKVSDEVVHRDGLFYVLSVIILMTAIFYSTEWTTLVGLIFIFTYFVYFLEIFRHGNAGKYIHRLKKFAKKGPSFNHKPKVRKRPSKIKLEKEVAILLGSLFLIILSSYFLVNHSIGLSKAIGVPTILIAFTITAAATSAPDMVISMANSRKGNIEDAASNVFGSNIFDILIGLGLPAIIAVSMRIPVGITTESMAIMFGLLTSTVTMLYLLSEDMILTKNRALMLIFIYIILIIFVLAII